VVRYVVEDGIHYDVHRRVRIGVSAGREIGACTKGRAGLENARRREGAAADNEYGDALGRQYELSGSDLFRVSAEQLRRAPGRRRNLGRRHRQQRYPRVSRLELELLLRILSRTRSGRLRVGGSQWRNRGHPMVAGELSGRLRSGFRYEV